MGAWRHRVVIRSVEFVVYTHLCPPACWVPRSRLRPRLLCLPSPTSDPMNGCRGTTVVGEVWDRSASPSWVLTATKIPLCSGPQQAGFWFTIQPGRRLTHVACGSYWVSVPVERQDCAFTSIAFMHGSSRPLDQRTLTTFDPLPSKPEPTQIISNTPPNNQHQRILKRPHDRSIDHLPPCASPPSLYSVTQIYLEKSSPTLHSIGQSRCLLLSERKAGVREGGYGVIEFTNLEVSRLRQKSRTTRAANYTANNRHLNNMASQFGLFD
ncbi:hypothetical protein Tco_1135446 [Tanacetum coccineum]